MIKVRGLEGRQSYPDSIWVTNLSPHKQTFFKKMGDNGRKIECEDSTCHHWF